MEPRKDDIQLADALQALRPTPRPNFAAKLDARAAAGFPRPASSPASVAVAGFVARLRAIPPRRLLAPAGVCTVLAIAAATAVIAVSENETPSDRSQSNEHFLAQPGEYSAETGAADAAHGSSGVQYSTTPPPAARRFAPTRLHRDIERWAQIVLGSDPAAVRGDAAKVLDAVHAFDGIVLRSSIRDGSADMAGASFHLLIPSGKLGDALSALSSIGEVRSRRESTQDITSPTIGAGERLKDSVARIESLLGELAAASTDGERAAVEAELRAERRQAALLRSRLTDLRRRAHFSHVWLRIETGSSSASDGDGDAWGMSDGIDDAGRILAIAAGVTVIGLAILAPFAVICLLVWLVHRTWVRKRRAQALA